MVLVIALFCVPLFVGLDRRDYDNDEAIYSFSVDVMLKSGDWLTPRLTPSETFPFLEKPPLKFWIVGLPIRAGLLAPNEFGMRFWDALMGSVALLYVLAIGRRLAGPICGLTAVLLLFAHGPLILEHGLRTNNMEAAVFLTYAGGMYHFLAWRKGGPDDRRHAIAIALYFVLGFMTKFVAALFLPVVLAIAVMLKPEDRLRLWLNWRAFALAGLLAVLLIAPWFVYQYQLRPAELFQTMFGEHVMKRLTAYLDPEHLHPWHFYLTELWSQLRANGTALLTVVGAALLLVRTVRRRWLEGALVILWFVVPVGIISAGTSKLYHYLYPFLPPVALAGGYAAAMISAWGWRWLQRPVDAYADWRDRTLPASLRAAPVRALLTTAGIAALMLAAATSTRERIRIAVGDTVLFRNSSVVRPMAAGVLALLMGAPAFMTRAVAPVVFLLTVIPLSAYNTTLTRSQAISHPLQDMRACLSTVVAQGLAQGRPAPGVWVEGRAIPHFFTYYLRGLGPWQMQDNASDATVAMHLFAPTHYRPVVLSGARYSEFMQQLVENTAGVMAAAGRMAHLDPEVLLSSLRQNDLGLLTLGPSKLLLPGPYIACSTERVHGTPR